MSRRIRRKHETRHDKQITYTDTDPYMSIKLMSSDNGPFLQNEIITKSLKEPIKNT